MKPIIAVTGSPVWLSQSQTLAEAVGFGIRSYTKQDGYVPRLVEDKVTLILVDGAASDWRFWCTTPKASPATRRIPIVLISAVEATRQNALTIGADFTLTPAQIETELASLIEAEARVLAAETVTQIEAQCQEPLPQQAAEAIELFNQRQFYKQHDLLEAQWMEETRPIRDLYRAILQVGVAYYQVERGNKRGAIKMLLRSMQWLDMLPNQCQGIDIASLKQDATAVLAALQATADDDISQFDRSLLKPVRQAGSQN